MKRALLQTIIECVRAEFDKYDMEQDIDGRLQSIAKMSGVVRRPRNGFIIFRSVATIGIREALRRHGIGLLQPVTTNDVSQYAGLLWKKGGRSLSAARTMCFSAARLEAKQHRAMFPHYTYRPAPARNKPQRSRPRATPVFEPELDRPLLTREHFDRILY